MLRRAWLQRGPLACVLWPLSLLYGAIVALHRFAWRSLARERVAVPVIVIGNVIAGGAGKTPVVMAVLQHLRARGWSAGVVSRGHGRNTHDCRQAGPQDDARLVGDEPLLIAQSCSVPVFVAPQRAQAARELLRNHPATDIIVSDDGLQHHRLHRDIEICVFDERGVGNGWLLPAGPLREPWPRQVTMVLRPADVKGIDGFQIDRRLAGHARRRDGSTLELAALRDRTLVAIAGIAKPEAFFRMLQDLGLTLSQTIALPDHHDFSAKLQLPPGCDLICTEKDAVKLWRTHPQAWAVPLELEIEASFWIALDALLDQLPHRLSSGHGSETS